MKTDQKLLQILITINRISNDKKLEFDQKTDKILREIISCMKAESGSIMLMKGRRHLEVIASTNDQLIGIKQSIEDQTPSSWVAKNKTLLYIDDIAKHEFFKKRYDHYRREAFLLAPIISRNKLLGVISVTDKINEDVFSKDEQTILLNIVGQIISALENQKLSESLKKKTQALQKKNRELKKLEKLKTDLFNMLIHDLKGPISEILANLDILSYVLTGENEEYVEAAKSGCDTLYRMVSNLLDIVRLEDGKLKLVLEKIEPADLIKEALARLFALVKMKEVTFIDRYPVNRNGEYFWGDRDILLRVMQNLLVNAIHYSKQGDTIEIGYEYAMKGIIEFYVKDKGPGVPVEFQEAIFDKYVQLEKKKDGRIYSTGLGLTFCKLAVKAHKGKIGVESRNLSGSRFYFSIPAEVSRFRSYHENSHSQ